MKNLSSEIIYDEVIDFYNLYKVNIIYQLKLEKACKIGIDGIIYNFEYLYIDRLKILFVKSFEKLDDFYYLDNNIYVIKYIERRLNINNIMNFVIGKI